MVMYLVCCILVYSFLYHRPRVGLKKKSQFFFVNLIRRFYMRTSVLCERECKKFIGQWEWFFVSSSFPHSRFLSFFFCCCIMSITFSFWFEYFFDGTKRYVFEKIHPHKAKTHQSKSAIFDSWRIKFKTPITS